MLSTESPVLAAFAGDASAGGSIAEDHASILNLSCWLLLDLKEVSMHQRTVRRCRVG